MIPQEEWNKIRKKIYKNAGYKCKICGAKGKLNCQAMISVNSVNIYLQMMISFILSKENHYGHSPCPPTPSAFHFWKAFGSLFKLSVTDIALWVLRFSQATFYPINKRVVHSVNVSVHRPVGVNLSF